MGTPGPGTNGGSLLETQFHHLSLPSNNPSSLYTTPTIPGQASSASDGSQQDSPPITLPAPVDDLRWDLTHAEVQIHLNNFFDKLSPVMPVFSKRWLQSRLDAGEHFRAPNLRSMLLSMCAITLIQPLQSATQVSAQSGFTKARLLIEAAIRERESSSLGEERDLDAVMTSFYLFACLFGLQRYGAAWIKLQESIALIQLFRINDTPLVDALPSDERDRNTRAYLLLAITERAFALQRRHPLALKDRPGRLLPAALPDVNGEGVDFLRSHLRLFDLIDEHFVDCWNRRCAGTLCHTVTPENAVALHRKLSVRLEGVDLPEWYLSSTRAIQIADVLVTQQWLINRLWQLCLDHRLIRPHAPEPELGLDVAISAARTAYAICQYVPMPCLEANGIGFAEKLYDVSMAVFNILSLWPEVDSPHHRPAEWDCDQTQPQSVRELLNSYLAMLATFRGGQHPYLQPLIQSIGSLQYSVVY